MSSTKNIKLLYWFNFFLDFKLYSPVAIIYFTKISESLALGMAVFSITTLISAISEIPTGIYSDRIGRKNTIAIGAFCSLLAAIFYAIGISFWILAIGSIFMGLSRSFFSGNNDALLYDTLREQEKQDKYHHYLGKASSMFQLALAISSIFGGFIANLSFAILMWISVVPQIICFFISLQMIEPKIHNKKESTNIYAHLKEASQQFFVNGRLRLLSIAYILGESLSEAAFLFRSAFIATLWPLWAIGISYLFSYLSAALSFFVSGKMIDKFKPIKLLLACTIYNRIANLASYIFPTVLSPIILSTTSLSYGITTTSENMLLQKEFTNHQRATMSSLNSLTTSIFFSIFSVVLGFMGDRLGTRYALLITTILSLSTVYLYWKIFHHDKLNNHLANHNTPNALPE